MTAEAARERLLQWRRQLRTEASSSADARATVELDQASVGRLSRMDAMQQQQMALAEQRRRQQTMARIGAALNRVDEGSYGECTACGEDIDPRHLKLDPAATLCLACAERRESPAGSRG